MMPFRYYQVLSLLWGLGNLGYFSAVFIRKVEIKFLLTFFSSRIQCEVLVNHPQQYKTFGES
jgi:hypothetical protein